MSPYKIETDKKLLPKKLDRRIKLTDSDRAEIKVLIQTTTRTQTSKAV